jgi:antimicrobial peptide system SdpA family protein
MTNTDDLNSRRLRWSGVASLGIGAVLSLATAYVALGNMDTSLPLPFADKVEIAVVAPEGWKFFTKDPHTERLFLFAPDGSNWRTASVGTNSEPSNLFGLSRDARAQGAEAGLIVERIPAAAWKTCDVAMTSCLTSDSDVTHLRNNSPRPTLCGSVGLVLQKPVPFEWARLSHPVTMPSRVARLEIQC